MATPAVIRSGAIFNECGKFRTRLWRIWDTAKPRALWVLLNPSTAGEHKNDPTIWAIMDFTERWGFGGVEVCNVYDFRATDPKKLRDAHYPQSRENEAVLRTMMTTIAAEGGIVVVGCGTKVGPNRLLDFRVDAQLLGVPLYHLGLNTDGTPKHPLYIKRTTPTQKWGEPL
jgi:hypothetical protein